MRNPLAIIMLHCSLLCGVLVSHPASVGASTNTGDPFQLLMSFRAAKQLFDTGRYRDAEQTLIPIKKALEPAVAESSHQHFDSYISVLDYLAQSRSQQGKTEGVLDLMAERHKFIESGFHPSGYVYASSLGRLAEAHYRDGNRQQAIELLQQSLDIYATLNPVPESVRDSARKNLMQYRIAPFSAAMLPMDLSEFYSRCELINSGDSSARTDTLMAPFVEVGVDYIPEGSWTAFFDALKYPSVRHYEGNSERRIFIPADVATMRDETCSVSVKSGVVISAESASD